MKTRKLLNKQMDFLSDDKDSIQWSVLPEPFRSQIEHLLSELMLSVVCQIVNTQTEDHDVQN